MHSFIRARFFNPVIITAHVAFIKAFLGRHGFIAVTSRLNKRILIRDIIVGRRIAADLSAITKFPKWFTPHCSSSRIGYANICAAFVERLVREVCFACFQQYRDVSVRIHDLSFIHRTKRKKELGRNLFQYYFFIKKSQKPPQRIVRKCHV